MATKEKQTRYPDRDGKHITTCAVEAYGRMGEEFLDLLRTLHTKAQQHDKDSGRHPASWLHRWLKQISFALARSSANALLEANTGPLARVAAPAPSAMAT